MGEIQEGSPVPISELSLIRIFSGNFGRGLGAANNVEVNLHSKDRKERMACRDVQSRSHTKAPRSARSGLTFRRGVREPVRWRSMQFSTCDINLNLACFYFHGCCAARQDSAARDSHMSRENPQNYSTSVSVGRDAFIRQQILIVLRYSLALR